MAEDSVEMESTPALNLEADTFQDIGLKAEIVLALADKGITFLTPVQKAYIQQLFSHEDFLCQEKPNTGKTTLFAVSLVQRIQPVDREVHILVLAHTRDLAKKIGSEFQQYSKFFGDIRAVALTGDIPIKRDQEFIKKNCPHIVVGTPGRILALAQRKSISLKSVKHFIMDECESIILGKDDKKDLDQLFKMLPKDKQVMMFSNSEKDDLESFCKAYFHKEEGGGDKAEVNGETEERKGKS